MGVKCNEKTCVDYTDGQPTHTPGTCDPKRLYDPCAKLFWDYTCDGGWVANKPALCSLEDYDVPPDPCENVRVPLFDTFRACCVQGGLKLQDFANLVIGCINFCQLLQQNSSAGADASPGFGGDFVTFNPQTCEYNTITLPTETPPVPICTDLKTLANGPAHNLGFGDSFSYIDPTDATCRIRVATLPTETVTPPPNLPVFANARFNNGTAAPLAAIGAKTSLTGISANRFTQHQNDAAGVFTAVANGIRVNRTGWYVIVAQIRTNTFDASGHVPAGFHGECDGLFVNGVFSGSHPNEEKTASSDGTGTGDTVSAWQIMSHNHVYLTANDVYTPSATSLTHSVVWSGEVSLTYMGY